MTDEPRSILVFRNGSIGNTLAAVPALRALRRRWPDAKLHVVVDSAGKELLAPCPWIDSLIVYDKRGQDRGLAGWLRIVGKLRQTRPTHAVLIKRFFRNGLLARLSGATTRIGFITAGHAPFLNLTTPYEEGVSVVDLNLRLAALLDAPPAGRELEVFLTVADRDEAQGILNRHNLLARHYIIAHYGGLTTAPDFLPLERFNELLRALSAPDEPVLLIGHGVAESAAADEIARACPMTISLTGIPLRTTAALMETARLFLGFNSGPAHLAAAVSLPEFILFRPDTGIEAEIRKWLPRTANAHPLRPPASADADAWFRFLEKVRTSIFPAQPSHEH